MYGMDSSSLSLLGFGAVVIIGAVAMYLISMFTMKETSFEAVIEEQKKKKAKEDEERSRQNKQKRELYKKRFDQKKKKTAVGNGKVEKMDSAVSPMHEVQIVETPQMETGEPAPVPEPKKQPKAKPAKKQQESHQTKDASPKPSHPILKQTPEKQKDTVPVTQAPKVENQANQQEKKTGGGRTRTVSFNDDLQEKQKNEELEKSKKKKKKEPEVESEIVGQLRETVLTDRDVQNVLTMVKQKYGIDVGGGSKIKDLQQQLDVTKKHLTQSENNYQQYANRCMAAENKIEQLKQDNALEKAKVTSLDKALQDSESKRKQEVSSMRSQHSSEMKQIQEKIAMASDYEEKCKMLEKLTTEKAYLLTEIQKNANVIGEKARLTTDLQQVRNQLQESQRNCSELEAKLNSYSKQTESIQQKQGEKEKQLLLQMSEQANAYQQIQQNYSKLDSEYQKIKSDLQTTQSDSVKLLGQVTALNEDNEAKVKMQKDLELRLTNSEQVISQRDSQIKDMSKRNDELMAQVQNLEQQITQLNSQIVKIDQDAKSKADADVKSADSSETHQKLQEDLDVTTKEKDRLKDEVDRLKKKNNELRERSWKAMDTLSNMEKSIPAKVAAAKAEGEVRCARLESSVKQSLSNAFPDVTVGEEDFEAWVKLFASQVSESSQTVQSAEVSSPELDEAREEMQTLRNKLDETSNETKSLKSKISTLEASVKSVTDEKARFEKSFQEKEEELLAAISEREKYKSVLNTTEEVLGKLQSSVEVEEGVWKKKVEEAHREASKAHQDAEDLRKTINELKSEKSSLQKNLNESEELKKRFEEMTSEVSELKTQLETAKAAVNDSLQQSEDLNKSAALANGYEDEVAKLKERLEKEKTLTKNLGQAATKLQNVLKHTQEQLQEEREKNSDLEKKIANENDVQENSTAAMTQQTTDTADGTCV